MKMAGTWRAGVQVIAVLVAVSAVAGCGGSGGAEGAAGSASDQAPTTGDATPGTGSQAGTGAVAQAASLVPAALRQAGVIVALDDTYPPLDFRDANGTLIGMRVDLARALGKELQIPTKVVAASFDSLIPGIEAGRYDMTSFNDTEEREQVLNFVDYYESGTSIVVPAGNPKGLSVHKLCGAAIAVERGSAQQTDILPKLKDECEGNGGIDVSVFSGGNEATLALKAGRVDAIISEQVNAEWVAHESDGKFEVPDEPPIEPHLVGWAVSKDADLGPALIAALEQLKEDGTYMKILEKWSLGSTALDHFPLNAATD